MDRVKGSRHRVLLKTQMRVPLDVGQRDPLRRIILGEEYHKKNKMCDIQRHLD